MNTDAIELRSQRGSLGSMAITDDLTDFYAAVAPHLDKMSRVAARLAGPGNRDDVLQDALLSAWEHRDQYDSARGSMSSWLIAITAHRATTVRRRVLRRLSPTVSASANDLESMVDLAAALSSLTPRERLAVDCYYFVGLSVSESAAAMGCSEGTVKSTLSAAPR